MRKILYNLFMGIAFLGSALYYTQIPFLGGSVVVFHINSFGVTWRLIVDLAIIGGLLCLYNISRLHFRVPIGSKHTTTIDKK